MIALDLIGDPPAAVVAALRERDVAADDAAPRLAVWAAGEPPAGWSGVRALLDATFVASQRVAREGGSAVYVVREEDVAGTRGAPAAMLACALVSAARALAFEGARRGVVANALAVDGETDPQLIARAVARAVSEPAPTGELTQLGTFHLGRSTP